MKFCTLTAPLFLIASSGIAAAQQVCYSDSIPLQSTDWATTVSVPQFDPSLGVLTSIDFNLSGEVNGSASVENLGPNASSTMTTYEARITLTRPDMSVIVIAIPDQMFTDNLAAFDGTIDFAGTSGIAHTGIVAQDMQSISSVDPLDFALFTGAGNIVLPIAALGTSVASGSGNLVTQFLTNAEASVDVCYNYVPDCNGNGIDDALDVSMGTSNDIWGDGIPDECQPSIRRFCAGDGAANGGADCPCGNNGNTLEGCDNGNGFGGVLTGSGVPSIANDTLVLTASQIPMVAPGFFFGGTQVTAAGTQNPFGSGLSCLVNPLRIQKIAMGGGSIPLMGAPAISVFMGLMPGDTTYFQFWYRNGNGPCISTTNATNGLIVTWGL